MWARIIWLLCGSDKVTPTKHPGAAAGFYYKEIIHIIMTRVIPSSLSSVEDADLVHIRVHGAANKFSQAPSSSFLLNLFITKFYKWVLLNVSEPVIMLPVANSGACAQPALAR